MLNVRRQPRVAVARERLDIAQLNARAAKGLARMFDAGNRLFCYKLRETGGGLVQEGISHRYTLITLLGLSRGDAARIESPVDIASVLDRLVGDLRWADNLGDLGLLWWTCALVAPDRLECVYESCDLTAAFERFPEVREGRTMEMAWLLAGLSHMIIAQRVGDRRVRDLALRTYAVLKRNQAPGGCFGHLATSGSLSGRLRGRIGSFADQVYPIYALSTYAQAEPEYAGSALAQARSCADAICGLQGALGQWWWHYDSGTGRVAEHYPVYSVHQEGMAPMALFALAEASGADYSAPIYKGLQWIAGQNEAGCDLRHESGVVWRCLRYTSRHKVYLDRAGAFLGCGQEQADSADLTLLRECRPYELGWLLYAFAGHSEAPAGIIIQALPTRLQSTVKPYHPNHRWD
jgi:hypothetical protein